MLELMAEAFATGLPSFAALISLDNNLRRQFFEIVNPNDPSSFPVGLSILKVTAMMKHSVHTGTILANIPAVRAPSSSFARSGGRGRTTTRANNRGRYRARSSRGANMPPRGCPPNTCWDFWRNESCRRGAACRFLHVNAPKNTGPSPPPRRR